MPFFRLFSRAFVIGLTILLHGLYWLLGWLTLLLAFRSRERRKVFQADRFRCLLRDLGATYVKVGQIMSTRPDIFPEHLVCALERLQDDVGAFAYRHVEASFQSEFGKGPSGLFASFDKQPIASASVAQVHLAVLASGQKVAVKIRRPGIEKLVAFDLSIMRGFARVLEFIPTLKIYAPLDSVREFGHAIAMQVDLRIEADNNLRFHENFAGNPDIVFPKLVPELCSQKILTMSFIEGLKVLRYAETDADPSRLARIGFHTLLQMIFEDGFVHADLHPGNIFITPDNKVALLDLGLTAQLSDSDRIIFAEFIGAWATADGKTMARLMVEFSPLAKVPDYEAFEASICGFIGRYEGKKLGEIAVSDVVFDMMRIMRRHRVRVNAVFTMVNIAIAVTEGIGRQLDDKLDLLTEALPFFVRLKQSGKL